MNRDAGGILEGKNILLGVTGGIGAYKAAQMIRDFRRAGARVSVVMTQSAARFISPLTMETLSGHPVGLDMFSLTEERTIGHIDRAGWADVLVVAPATANYLGKAAGGIADDLLTTVTLAVTCPVVVAPAMNSRMWAHPAVSRNLEILSERGVRIVPPGEGELACGEEGPGRLAEPERIIDEIAASVRVRDLEGIRITVTAGPTREPIDPVRYISNRSSGRMGFALARAAAQRGAVVTLVAGPVHLPPPRVPDLREVTTAREMLHEVRDCLETADWLIMAAAVADYAPARFRKEKMKKGEEAEIGLRLERNPDILATVAPVKGNRLFVGFAAETGELMENARKKVTEKSLDLIVANDVSSEATGFDSEENSGYILDGEGLVVEIPRMTKVRMAERILDEALRVWKGKTG